MQKISKQLINYKKRGAMFGLDARIAMLIIALLGLIIFPFFLGVVNKAKAEAIIASSKAVNTVISQYILDTSSHPASIDNLFDTLPTKASQQAKWNGPYLNGYKDDKYMPSLSFTVVDNNCTSNTKSSRYCSVRPVMTFCQFPAEVFQQLETYFSSDTLVTYNSGSKCITIEYGHAKTGAVTKSTIFKVKELA